MKWENNLWIIPAFGGYRMNPPDKNNNKNLVSIVPSVTVSLPWLATWQPTVALKHLVGYFDRTGREISKNQQTITDSVNCPSSIQLVDWLSKIPVVQSGYLFWFELQPLFKKVLVYKNYVDCVLHANFFSGERLRT